MLLQYIFDNPLSTLYSLFIGLLVALVFQVVKFYAKVRTLPPGPLPLPLLGNILVFMKKGDQLPHEVICSFSKQFGPVFTFWTGPAPQVVVNDAKIAREALTKVEFAGRPSFGELSDVVFGKDSVSVAFADFGREWEVLRKVTHSAVRKFAVDEKLPFIIDTRVKSFLREIKDQNGDKPFDPADYVAFLMMSLLATTAFGREFKMSDSDFHSLHRASTLQKEYGNRLTLMLFIPALKYVLRETYTKITEIVDAQQSFAVREYNEHQRTYTEGVIRDFTDAMIFAKKEAEAEDSNDAKYLKDRNIVNSVIELFSAGSETTVLTLLWILMFLAEYQEHQKSIREEVEAALESDEIPTLEHRPQCNLLQAFIAESMRMRIIVPFGLPHKTIVDTELGGHKIKKDVGILISLEAGSMDKEIWGDPEVFKPERFLDENGKFVPKPNQFFVPFSAGRRGCLGDKLASANLFLIIAGLLHQTKDRIIAFPDGPGSYDLRPTPEVDTNVQPRPYKLIFDRA